MPGIEQIMVFIIALIIAVLPVKLAASAIGAERSEFGWCFLALVVASVFYSFGLQLVPNYGVIVAFVLSAIGFMLILRTSFLGGLGVAVLYLVFSLIIGWALTKLGFGRFANLDFWDLLNMVR